MLDTYINTLSLLKIVEKLSLLKNSSILVLSIIEEWFTIVGLFSVLTYSSMAIGGALGINCYFFGGAPTSKTAFPIHLFVPFVRILCVRVSQLLQLSFLRIHKHYKT